MGGKEVTRNYERIWPDPSGNGKVVNVSQRALDQLRKFREAEAMKKAIKKVQEAKNNGGT